MILNLILDCIVSFSADQSKQIQKVDLCCEFMRILFRVFIIVQSQFHFRLILVAPLLNRQKTARSPIDRKFIGHIAELKLKGGPVSNDPVRVYLDDAGVIGLFDDA